MLETYSAVWLLILISVTILTYKNLRTSEAALKNAEAAEADALKLLEDYWTLRRERAAAQGYDLVATPLDDE